MGKGLLLVGEVVEKDRRKVVEGDDRWGEKGLKVGREEGMRQTDREVKVKLTK